MKIWASIALIVYVAACGIATSLPLGTVKRLDTTNIIGFQFENSIIMEYTIDRIIDALPNETALCYTGFIKDTTFLRPNFINPTDSTVVTMQLLIIDGVSEANIRDAGPRFVRYHDGTGCDPQENLVATGHSHPNIGRSQVCDHSDVDAVFHHSKGTKYVVSFVWCPHAVSVLWADGRRWSGRPPGSPLDNKS